MTNTTNSKRKLRVWSASPTPFHDNLSIDEASLGRLIDHHAMLGCDGLFLAGTCGEGPWLTNRQRVELVQKAAVANRGRLRLAAQVTDNSASRVLEQIDAVAGLGLDLAVVAQPAFFMNPTPARVLGYYLDILNASPLPVCIYDRGWRKEFPLTPEILSEIFAHPRAVMIKDSSVDPTHRDAAIAARSLRPDLVLLTGDEFSCPAYLDAGYDGMMTGGAVVAARFLRRMCEAHVAGLASEVSAVDAHMRKMLLTVYGGESITCWLTGLKHALVRLGVFSTTASFLQYPLTSECREGIDELADSNALLDCSSGD